jgi:hypothetical protein
MGWLSASFVTATLLAALVGCEDDSAYKGGKPLNTTGGPTDGGGSGDGGGDAAVMDGGPASDGASEAPAAD